MHMIGEEFPWGHISYFLDITIHCHKGGLFLDQTKYTIEIVENDDISSCKPATTPVDSNAKLP